MRLAALVLVIAIAGCDQRLVLVRDQDASQLDASLVSNARDLSAGVDHTCLLLAGSLYCAGHDASGQLGLPDGMDRLVLSGVGIGGGWTSASAGYGATCLLDVRGGVSCFGDNTARQLATGDTIARPTPTRVSLPRPAIFLQLHFDHACAALDDASLWCWGSNAEGELGQGDGGMLTPATPVRVSPALSWASASCGQGHTCAITTDGALYCWGRNMGALGLGPTMLAETSTPMRVGTGSWRQVIAGQLHTCAIAQDRTLWCWGWDGTNDGHAGPLGLPGDAGTTEPTQIDPGVWSMVSTDTFHTCAVRSDGSLWCWGRNIEGQLGTGTLEVVDTPRRIGTDSDWERVAVGRFYTCAQKTDGSVWCTGANDFGETGIGTIARRNILTRVDPVTNL